MLASIKPFIVKDMLFLLVLGHILKKARFNINWLIDRFWINGITHACCMAGKPTD